MIGSLRGSVVDKDPDGEIVIEVAGVGYRVSVNPRTLGDLSDVGLKRLCIFTTTYAKTTSNFMGLQH